MIFQTDNVSCFHDVLIHMSKVSFKILTGMACCLLTVHDTVPATINFNCKDLKTLQSMLAGHAENPICKTWEQRATTRYKVELEVLCGLFNLRTHPFQAPNILIGQGWYLCPFGSIETNVLGISTTLVGQTFELSQSSFVLQTKCYSRPKIVRYLER